MGLLLRFLTTLTPRSDVTYDRLPTSMDVDVLDRDALLPLPAVMVEGFGQSRVSSGELVRLGQVLASSFEGLIANHRTPVALHGGTMARDQLHDQHSVEPVARFDPDHDCEHCLYLAPLLIGIAVAAPKSVGDLVNEQVGEIVVVRAADRPQIAAPLSGQRDLDSSAALLCPSSRSFLLKFSSLGSRSGA
jgi:hypothetical protein